MLLLLPLLVAQLTLVQTHHILVFHGCGTKSHLLLLAPLMEELLDRGNRITSIVFSSIGIEHENLTEIVLPTDNEARAARLSNLAMQKPGSTLIKKKYCSRRRILDLKFQDFNIVLSRLVSIKLWIYFLQTLC